MLDRLESRKVRTVAEPRGLRLVQREHTVADLVAEHLAAARRRVKVNRLAASTLQTLEQRYAAVVLPALGKLPLRLLALGAQLQGDERSKPHGVELVELWHAEAVAKHGPTQANRAAEALRGAWLLAERREWVQAASSPFRFFRTFRAQEAWETAEVRVLTENEMCAFLAECRRVETESPLRSQRFAAQALQLLALTGGRKDEILRLTWAQVDLEAHVLRLKTSKTGPKLIPLGEEAIAVLARVERLNGEPRCFPHANWRTVFWPARQAIGAPDITLHDLRHTWATRAIENGVPVEMVAAVLGQKTVSVTRRHYFQPDVGALVKTADRGSRIIAGLPHEETENMADETKERRSPTSMNVELPPALLNEIARETGESGDLKRSSVMEAIRADLETQAVSWIGQVRTRMYRRGNANGSKAEE